jgi:hypothetical protein
LIDPEPSTIVRIVIPSPISHAGGERGGLTGGPANMGWIERQATVALRAFIGIACRAAAEPLDRLWPRGPLILVAKRINPLETLWVFVQRRPCPAAGFASAEG